MASLLDDLQVSALQHKQHIECLSHNEIVLMWITTFLPLS